MKRKGISLIVLVITIIVLIILASVAVTTLTGQRGISNRAQNAVYEAKKSQALEEIQVDWSIVLIDGSKNNWNNTQRADALEIELKKKDIDATAEFEENITGVYKGYSYTIYLNTGRIELGEPAAVVAQPTIEELMAASEKHPDQRGTDDVGIDARGRLCNLDLWLYEPTEGDDTSITMVCENIGCSDGPCYIPNRPDEMWEESEYYTNNVERDNIAMPQYIKIAGEDEFRSVKHISRAFGSSYPVLGADITSLVLPATLEEISISCFTGCSNLVEINIPYSVNYVDEIAFDGCTGTIIFNNGTKEIEVSNRSFAYWRGDELVENVIVNGNICDGMFAGLPTLKHLTIKGNNRTAGEDVLYKNPGWERIFVTDELIPDARVNLHIASDVTSIDSSLLVPEWIGLYVDSSSIANQLYNGTLPTPADNNPSMEKIYIKSSLYNSNNNSIIFANGCYEGIYTHTTSDVSGYELYEKVN